LEELLKIKMELTQKVSLAPEVLMQELGSEAVFLNCELEEYFSLDEVGARMLAVLQESPSIQAACAVLLEEYAVEPAQLQQDLLDLIQQLEAHGLVEVAGA
jgi:hypothetical protein